MLTWFPSHEELPDAIDAEHALSDTEDYWLDWAGKCGHHGDYHDEIHQSLLVLKALTYAPTGGIVAAPTTSLPEHIGGVRNWDYRYCWLRDATLTLLAMLNAGYRDEAEAWRGWLLRAVAGDPADLQIMYGIAGERRLDELELDWLPGFDESKPVRVGNAASSSSSSTSTARCSTRSTRRARTALPPDDNAWALIRKLLEWLEDGWRLEDCGHLGGARAGAPLHALEGHGLGRVRPRRSGSTRSSTARARSTAGVRCATRSTPRCSSAAGARRSSRSRSRTAPTSSTPALLLLPLVGFLPPDDERIVSTVEAIRRELTVDGLVLRYRVGEHAADDGLPGDEGVFLPCSFWLAQVLALQGRHDEARELFERLLDLRNDVGLLSEEYDPRAGSQLGNFPQAFTHLALVDAAIALGAGPDDAHLAACAHVRSMRTYVRIGRRGCPARRSGRLLRVGRAAGRPAAAWAPGHRRRGRRARGELRGQGLRRQRPP